MGRRPNRALLEKTERKLQSPLGAPQITEQPRRHGSTTRWVRDPMTQGYWPRGVVGHVAWRQGSRLKAQDRSSLFFAIPGRSKIGRGGDVTNLSPFWEGAT